MTPVSDEQNDVVVFFDHRIVMRLHHLVTSHDGADAGARGQFNVIDLPADHP